MNRFRRNTHKSITPADALLVSGLVFLVLATAACERRPVKLLWKLEQGKTYVYKNEVTGTWKIEGWEMGERGGPFGNVLTTEMTVESMNADSSFHVKEVTKLMREGAGFAPTVVTYSMASNGKIYSLEIRDTGTAPRAIPVTRERTEKLYEETQPTFPDRILRPGDTWVQETKVVLEERVITTTNEFEVKAWEKAGDYMCLRIDYKGETVVPYERKGLKVVDKGKVKGSMWFSPEEGLLIQQQDSIYIATARVVPEGEKPPSTYVVQSSRIYKLVEVK